MTDSIHDQAVKEAKEIANKIVGDSWREAMPIGNYQKTLADRIAEALKAHLVRIEVLESQLEEAERKGRDLCEVHGVTLIENSSLKESLKGAVKVLNEIHSFPLENSHVHFDYGRIKGIVDIKLAFLKSKHPEIFGGEKP